MEAISFTSQSITMRGTSSWGLKQKRRRGRPLQARCDVHNEDKFKRFSQIAVTMTIVSAGLPQAAAAASATAEVKKKKVTKKKEVDVMPPEERKAWTSGFPVVEDRIPDTDILELKLQGRLKHIIMHPLTKPKIRPEIILVVLDDDRVLGVQLRAPNRDVNFWDEWDRLELNKAAIEAYTPPLPKPPPPPRAWLEFLLRGAQGLQPPKKKWADDPQLLAVRRKKKELERQRVLAEVQKRYIREREAEARRQQKKMEKKQKKQQKQRREEEKKEKKLKKQQLSYLTNTPSDYWRSLSENEPLEYLLGIIFFVLFYVVFILSHKKRRKDYDDRQKIEEAEQEEKEKMIKLEEDLVDSRLSQLDETAENNEQLKASMQFLRSGAPATHPAL